MSSDAAIPASRGSAAFRRPPGHARRFSIRGWTDCLSPSALRRGSRLRSGSIVRRLEPRGPMTVKKPFKLAVLWSGDRALRESATAHNSRYKQIFAELAALGIHAEPAVYADDMVSEVREQLLRVDGVLVWVNPIFDGGNRAVLDTMLRDVAATGIWVSAHPDVILKMGTKEILHRTKHLCWGTDTQLYRSVQEFRDAFPS